MVFKDESRAEFLKKKSLEEEKFRRILKILNFTKTLLKYINETFIFVPTKKLHSGE